MKRGREEIKNIVYCLDASASMELYTDNIIKAMNENIKNLPLEDNIYVTIYKFNDKLTKIREGYVSEITELRKEDYYCCGATSLYDFTCQILKKLTRNTLFIITTDGSDTSSEEFTLEQCKNAIKNAQDTRGIIVIYIAQGNDAIQQGNDLELEDDYILQSQDISQTLSSESCKTLISQYIK